MHKSHYFEELSASYSAEIDDLVSDSEGKSVLTLRLKEKRRELDALLQMIEFAPEMVAPVFFDAFAFEKMSANLSPVVAAIQCEPDDGEFPAWDDVASALTVVAWAKPLVEKTLAAAGGEAFMVSVVALEFLRLHDVGASSTPVSDESNDSEDSEDDEDADLAESGADWLAEQGFDSQQ